MAEAWLLHHRGSLADIGPRLARAGALLQQTPLAEEARLGLQGEIDALTSQLVYWTADAERTLALARRALAETPIERSYVRGIAWMFVAGALAIARRSRGCDRSGPRGPARRQVPQQHVRLPLAVDALFDLLDDRRPAQSPANGRPSARPGARARPSGKRRLGALLPGMRPLSAERPGRCSEAISRRSWRIASPSMAWLASIVRSAWHRPTRPRVWPNRRAPPPNRS